MVGKIALFITVVTNGPTQVLIFPMRWLVAATVIMSRGLSCVDLNGQGEALRPEAAGAKIATIAILPTLLVVLSRSLSFGGLRAIGRNGSCLLKAEQSKTSVWGVIFDRF